LHLHKNTRACTKTDPCGCRCSYIYGSGSYI